MSESPVFVETTAVVLNALGSREIRDGIRESTHDATLFSSLFVLTEFREVLSGLYDGLRERLLVNAEPDRSDSITEVMRQAMSGLPPRIPGGYPAISDLAVQLGRYFGNRAVTPRQVANWLEGEKVAVECSGLRFSRGYLDRVAVLIDNHTCCVFEGEPKCGDLPAEHCRFEWVCGSQRQDFLNAVSFVADSTREEGVWLKKNLDRVASASGTSLLRLVGKHIGHFGDVIIFSSVPDGSQLLTRDHTFDLLVQSTGRSIRVIRVRAQRRLCDVEAVVTQSVPGSAGHFARIVNWTSRDCMFVVDSAVGRVRDEIKVFSNALGIDRRARIMRVSRSEQGVEHGVRFKNASYASPRTS